MNLNAIKRLVQASYKRGRNPLPFLRTKLGMDVLYSCGWEHDICNPEEVTPIHLVIGDYNDTITVSLVEVQPHQIYCLDRI